MKNNLTVSITSFGGVSVVELRYGLLREKTLVKWGGKENHFPFAALFFLTYKLLIKGVTMKDKLKFLLVTLTLPLWIAASMAVGVKDFFCDYFSIYKQIFNKKARS